jgi:hypothetical protein
VCLPARLAESTPLFAEMAIPGSVFGGSWQERDFLRNQELTRALGWRSVPSAKAIIDSANEYAEAQIALHLRYAEAANLPALAATVRRLQEELAAAQSAPLTCLLCLGWGGGFTSKAGYLGTDQQAFRKVLQTVPALSTALREGTLFPKTRRIVFVGGHPATLPGWVRAQFAS